MNNLLKILLLVSLFSIISCNEKKMSMNMVEGVYGIDKGLLRDSLIEMKEYPLLTLKKDSTFYLSDYENNKKEGIWEIVKSNEHDAIIKFTLNNKSIEVKLEETRFYFDYPNCFYSGRFKRILYVKTNQPVPF